MAFYLHSCASLAARWRRDRAGATAIEFGMIGLPFLMLIVSTIFVGFILYSQSALDYATQKAARQVFVGNTQSSAQTADLFRTQTLCPQLPAAFNCSNVIVSLQTIPSDQVTPSHYYDFVNATQTGLIVPQLSNTVTKFCPGGSGQYKLLQVFYPMPVFLSIFANSPQVITYGGGSAFLLMSASAFKNEPFNNGGYTAPIGC